MMGVIRGMKGLVLAPLAREACAIRLTSAKDKTDRQTEQRERAQEREKKKRVHVDLE